MERQRTTAGPVIITIVVLLLLLYTTSYLLVVQPPERPGYMFLPTVLTHGNYRFGGRNSARIFWPLEQIDRKVRPGLWDGDPFT